MGAQQRCDCFEFWLEGCHRNVKTFILIKSKPVNLTKLRLLANDLPDLTLKEGTVLGASLNYFTWV